MKAEIIPLAQTNQHTSAHRGRAGIYHALPSLGLGGCNVSCGSQFTSGERPHFHRRLFVPSSQSSASTKSLAVDVVVFAINDGYHLLDNDRADLPMN